MKEITLKSMRNEVTNNMSELPKLTKEQIFFFHSILDDLGTTTRGKLQCLECGHIHKDKFDKLIDTLEPICEKCKSKLRIIDHNNRVFKDSYYGGILTTHKGYQVIRMFWVEKYATRSKVSNYFISEVIQHWIHPSGISVYCSKSVQAISSAYDQWIFTDTDNKNVSTLRIKAKQFTYRGIARFEIKPYIYYPGIKVIKQLRRNGFKRIIKKLDLYKLFLNILTEEKYETLLKARYYDLLEFSDNKINKYWNSIKICIRNDYKARNWNDYFDYLGFLEDDNKDLRNAHYVCPEDLDKEHQRYVKKRAEIRRKKRQKELREQIEIDNIKYQQKISRFINLKFTNKNLEIIPMKDVQQILYESTLLKHCAFDSNYQNKETSLLLSARAEGEVKETIELSLKTFEILQARGLRNKSSKYHNDIISLMNKNIPRIKKVANKKRKELV